MLKKYYQAQMEKFLAEDDSATKFLGLLLMTLVPVFWVGIAIVLMFALIGVNGVSLTVAAFAMFVCFKLIIKWS